jgi:hypothetical protein
VNPERILALVLLVLAGIFSLPAAAYFFDSPGSENWIVPVQLGAMALIGALLGRWFPGTAGQARSSGKAALLGAASGVVAGLVGIIVSFLLLNGFSGA